MEEKNEKKEKNGKKRGNYEGKEKEKHLKMKAQGLQLQMKCYKFFLFKYNTFSLYFWR